MGYEFKLKKAKKNEELNNTVVFLLSLMPCTNSVPDSLLDSSPMANTNLNREEAGRGRPLLDPPRLGRNRLDRHDRL